MADYERIRLVFYGDAGVGKSAIMRRLLGQGYTDKYRATIEDLYSRDFVLGTLTFKVDLLDTAGDQQFPAMRRLSIATSHAFLLVYSTCSLASFEYVKRCFAEIREQRPDFQEVPIVFAGNKVDLPESRREVSFEDVSNWVFSELPRLRAKVIECSAKNDHNVKEIFKTFVNLSKIVPRNTAGETDESKLRRRCSAYGSRRSDSPGKSSSNTPGSQQVLAAQGSTVVTVVEEQPKSKPRSRSLIRRGSRKAKQQIRDSHSEDCNVS